ncbi:HlyD family efflux transporter periplasmic adaptor subunit [Aminipila butyrica]|uniref:HlyD family efflux transporter periplasmic adaptor subunit n=1 Tax=Aminipila butyrica TaxID=433296 RepID=A0A858BT27_9FIRM|nr:efflux RND transporter periplasmic adaptor subunit [Aminipila butyrica]QIB68100.1 HlyD family efflux transporter periplasmic adaptor subunit [Aminipila butyrica]
MVDGTNSSKGKGAVKAVFSGIAKEVQQAGIRLEGLFSKIPLLKKLTVMPGKKKRVVYTALALAVLVPAGYVVNNLAFGRTAEAEVAKYTVKKGNVEVAISGSGTVTPVEQYNISTLVEGDVLQDTFEEGDDVQEGDVLYVIDSEEMENSLEKADIALEKQQISYSDSVKAYAGLKVTSPIKGMIDELYVAKGDSVQKGTKMAKLVNNDTMTARVPFSEIDAEGLYVGEVVTVTVENTFEQLTGKISKLYNSKRVLNGYITVTDVEIQVSNPGYLQTGTYVSVTADGKACYSSAALEGSGEKIVLAETAGTVNSINVEGAYLKQGDVIATLDSDNADDDLRNSQLSLRESQISYNNTQKQLDNYTITSPISGTVISKTIKAGDTMDENTSTTMAVIADMSKITFEISVDELDIASMSTGQTVDITADALPDQAFTGYVEKIGLLGTATEGVTSYPVTIVINEPEGLWPGMNVTGNIVIDSAEDVLVVPVDAVARGNKVTMEDGTEQEVSIGLSDDNNVEIKSGLAAGDVIQVKMQVKESSSQNDMMGNPSMGGGPPSGGGGGENRSGGGAPGGGAPGGM